MSKMWLHCTDCAFICGTVAEAIGHVQNLNSHVVQGENSEGNTITIEVSDE